MSTHPFVKSLAILLSVVLIVPSVFLIAPQRAQAGAVDCGALFAGVASAIGGAAVATGAAELGSLGLDAVAEVVSVPTSNISLTVKSTITAIETTLSKALLATNTAAAVAQQINVCVLQPLAFILSGNLMKMLTSSVIAFVIGKANGTGVPQFVVDIQRSMQTVADGRALAYLRQVNQTKSPFAYSIQSALATNYLTKSSLAGFWAANMNTLARSSPSYAPSYLSGNWSRGGIAAWFALTTQTQNNPYTLYDNARNQLGNVIGPGAGGATGARAQELSFGQGFMSWCGTSDAATKAANFSATAAQNMAATTPIRRECTASNSSFRDAPGDCYASAADAAAADQINNASETLANKGIGRTPEGGIGINPGDPCTNADGTPGAIKTPGSVIKETLGKVLGGQQDQIARMGNVGPQINQILGNIGTVLSTVNFAASLLGGGNQGGLLAVNSTSASRSISQLEQFTPTAVTDSKGNVTDFTTKTLSAGNVVKTSGYLGTTQDAAGAAGAAIITTAKANETAGNLNAGIAAFSPTVAPSITDISTRITQYETAWSTIKASADTASTNVLALEQLCIKNGGTSDGSFRQAAGLQLAAAQDAFTNEIKPVFVKINAALTTIDTARKAVQKVAGEAASATAPAGSTYTADTQALETMSPTDSEVLYAQQNAKASRMVFMNSDGSINTSLIIPAYTSFRDQMNTISTNAKALEAVCDPNSSLYVILQING